MEPVPDTISIVEHQMQEVKSSGADIRCSITLNGRFAGTPEPVLALRRVLIDGGHTADCLTIESTTSSNQKEALGCLGMAWIGFTVLIYSKGENLNILIPAIGIGGAILLAVFWWFNRTTTCTFKIHCGSAADVERTHKKLGEIDKIQVFNTDWRYEVDSSEITNWAEKCIQRAHFRAEKVAAALGVLLDGVHSYDENPQLPRNSYTPSSGAPSMSRVGGSARAKAAVAPHNWNDTSGSERAGLAVVVRYRIKKT